MYKRLRDAIRISLPPEVVAWRGDLKPGEAAGLRLVDGQPWTAYFDLKCSTGTALRTASVPGPALEASGFGFSRANGALVDVNGKGIQGVDTVGIPLLVVQKAFDEALAAAAQAPPRPPARAATKN
jgi:hypothetical protein